ncbi:hypothetical protein UFOVP388_49 [uncultured Caudovirales phage]|uniref:Uncharacterized protein n=1 Tax=uncultured Caudovirales phage TaxID=2100421 RepID=A0A6J7X1L8_9CAUD|nr:hypothetical protein UFOVP388_49 [uncultured Caudovirales phage]
MSDTINITVNETIDNIVVNPAISTDVIDMNTYSTTETINIDVTPELTTVNINTVTGGNLVTSVNGEIGDVVIPTGNVNDATTSVKGILKLAGDLAGTADLPTVPNKVDKVAGKGLSANDFTNTLKTKLDGIADGAEVNVNADWNATSGDAQILNKPTIPSISGLELQANKQNSLAVDGTGVKYPTVDAVNSGLSSVNTNSIRRDTVKLATAINKGQAVYVSSANGTNIIVSKASNTSEATSSKTIGLLETTGAINAIVNVVTDGLLTGLDTSTATIGDPVWLGVSGDLIYGLINKPYAPAHLVYIGVVTRVNANNGEILVKVQNGFELKEIHDCDLISNLPTNNQVLAYESGSLLWKNKSIPTILGYTPSRTFFSGADGTTVSNTTDQTATYSRLIPAGSFSAGDVVEVLFRALNPLAKTAISSIIIYVHTNSTLTPGTPIQVGVFAGSATQRTLQMTRTLAVKGATTRVVTPGSSGNADTVLTGASALLTINWAVDQYFIFVIQHTLALSTESLTGDCYRIIKN